jgi:DNA topoisomerase-1
MSPALFETRRIDIADAQKELVFRATGQVLKFEGFLKIYPMRLESKLLPELKKQAPLKLHKILPSQHFTEPPPRYTEALLVKALKDNGVGRPSTYAPTIEVIQRRRYVEKRARARLYLTDLGEAVNNLLTKHFPKIVDIEFTAHMEDDLDKIAEGKKQWQPVIAAFYWPFEKQLIRKEKEISKKDLAQKTDKICPKCGAPIVIKFGRFGQFFSCSKFPECKHAEPILDKIGLKCPKCQKGEIIRRRSQKGRVFFGCSRFPNCKNAYWDEPVNQTCPNCNSILVKKGSNKLACSNKECGFTTKALRGRTSQSPCQSR